MRRAPIVRAAAAGLAAAALAGCGGAHKAASPNILDGSAQDVSFAQVESDVTSVYAHHPAISSYSVRDVVYPPTTRDTVLAVCRRGGGSLTAADLETSRVEACAPLIFFFYRYGLHASASDSTELARKLYEYAVTNVKGPFDARKALDELLTGWGVK
ncbi:MAG TPA: hypothetical protein VFA30_03600 [Gaiellaceae bacterium]|nr:hypothetical protein [Gaiellaceae bacterium]